MGVNDFTSTQKPFLEALEAAMRQQNMSLEELANRLDIPYSYIIAIKNGNRTIGRADSARVEKFATFLKVPPIQIYVWAGELEPRDFIFTDDLDQRLTLAYDRMAKDPVMITILPKKTEWKNPIKWPINTKVALVRIYELLFQELLLEHATGNFDKKSFSIVKNTIRRSP
jgi:transcriptional regulator with XRE-family HTH domain